MNKTLIIFYVYSEKKEAKPTFVSPEKVSQTRKTKQKKRTHLTTSIIPGCLCVAQYFPLFSPGIAKPGLCWQLGTLHLLPLIFTMPSCLWTAQKEAFLSPSQPNVRAVVQPFRKARKKCGVSCRKERERRTWGCRMKNFHQTNRTAMFRSPPPPKGQI